MKKEYSQWGLNFILGLNPAKYNYVTNIGDLVDFKGDSSKMYFGVMAQDIEDYIEKQGHNSRNYNILNYSEDYMSVNYYELIGPMIKSIQELEEKVTKLEQKLKDKDE